MWQEAMVIWSHKIRPHVKKCYCSGLNSVDSTILLPNGGVGGTVASESALRSAGTILSRVRTPPPAPWPDGGPESLRSPCCGLAIYKNPYY
ncbi:hypothetical protein PoB_006461700 [Plakobranchus ocellatus]|uniref:Uncharacterized protein n=1 Tax=Plakobranchus ocellatus TaxID=259542 RepID=A0AAV4D1T3_9GAST|nr:hypothetical protein PoB_006461700 [Plakobranchus ocellatus]